MDVMGQNEGWEGELLVLQPTGINVVVVRPLLVTKKRATAAYIGERQPISKIKCMLVDIVVPVTITLF